MRILFSCIFLDGYHGSVMLVKEHAEYLASKRGGSHDVTVATVIATPEITDFFTSSGVTVRQLLDVDVTVHYDIVFAYHYPTLDTLLERGMRCKKLVMGSLSSFEKLESFPQYWDTASLLIVMSRETKEVHHSKYGIPREKMLVFENNIPDAYAEYAISCPSHRPYRIAVVSNHIPQEVEELPKHLPKECDFTMIGAGREICAAVTPQLLSKFDVVISIGKTVQYAMGMGIPVFEYDYFGGNGYVTPETLAKEAENNFSGRPEKRKLKSPALAAEIIKGYAEARVQAPALRELALERFLLSKKMEELLEIINNSNKFEIVSGGGTASRWLTAPVSVHGWGSGNKELCRQKLLLPVCKALAGSRNSSSFEMLGEWRSWNENAESSSPKSTSTRSSHLLQGRRWP